MKPTDKVRLFDRVGTGIDTWCCGTLWLFLSKIPMVAMIVLWCLVTICQYPDFNLSPAKPGQVAYLQVMILQVPLCDRSNLNTAMAQARLLGGSAQPRSGYGGGADEAFGGLGAVTAQAFNDLFASELTGWTFGSHLLSDGGLYCMHAASRGPPVT